MSPDLLGEIQVGNILQVNLMDSRTRKTVAEYGFYYVPGFSFYFSAGYFGWQSSVSSLFVNRCLLDGM